MIVWLVVSTTPDASGSNRTCGATALASASALLSVLFSDQTVTTPGVVVPAVIVRPSGISALAVDSVTATPTAPATCTGAPPCPDAEAPVVDAVPLPAREALARVLAALR